MAAPFAELSEDEMSSLLDEKNAANTKKATKTAINVFRQYLEAKDLKEDDVLASKEPTFFASFMQKQERETANFNSKSSLLGIRLGLQRL